VPAGRCFGIRKKPLREADVEFLVVGAGDAQVRIAARHAS
jgi:hypothetical protein